MSQIFETIARVQPGLPGWCLPEKAETLAAIVLALHSHLTVEVGVFGGSSFFPMALAHRQMGSGIIYGIDAWDVKASIEGETVLNIEYWNRINHEEIYEGFLRLLIEHGLVSCSRIIRKRSDDVVPPVEIDVLHLDGNHTDQALKDTKRYAPWVRQGGFCIMDDEHWAGGGVTRACQYLTDNGFRRLYQLGSGAVFQRI